MFVLHNKGFKEITKKRARFYLNFNQKLHGGGSAHSAQIQPETRKEIIRRIINDEVYDPDNFARYEYVRDRMRIGWEDHIVHIIDLALQNGNIPEQNIEEIITRMLNHLDNHYSRPENETPRDEGDEINTPRMIQEPNLHGSGNQISEMIDNISGRNRIRPERIPEENQQQRARRVRVQPLDDEVSSVVLRSPESIERDYAPLNTTDEYILHWLNNKRHGREFRKEYNRDRQEMIKRVQRKIRNSRGRKLDRDNVWWAINKINEELDERVAREMER